MDPILIAILIILVPLAFAFLKNAYMAPMLILANIGIFVFIKYFVWDGSWDGYYAVTKIALTPFWIAQGEQLQSFFTSMFMHIDNMHIFFNMIFLIFWAPVLESRIGARQLGIVYLVTGIVGGFASVLFNWGDIIFILGASGALFGIAGCYVALYPKAEMRMLLLFIPLPKMKGYTLLAVMFLFIVALEFIGVVGNIAHEAHLGGMLAGIALGKYVIKPIAREKRKDLEVVTIEALVPLATTPALQEMLEHAKSSKEAEIVYAWIQEFLENATCPTCGATLEHNKPKDALKGKVTCASCSWSA